MVSVPVRGRTLKAIVAPHRCNCLVDALTFRQAMGLFPTGVTVVTACAPDGQPVGVTVNSFASVSLQPPLVLVCIDRAASTHDDLVAAGRYTVNVLAEGQTDVALNFATAPADRRFEAVAWEPGHEDVPRLRGVVAWLECALDSVHRAGDHSILVGRVLEVATHEREALVYHRGAYGAFAP